MQYLVAVMEILFLGVVACFAVYVLLELRTMLISRAVQRRNLVCMEASAGLDFCPQVAVLLPICNESNVIEGLIAAVCKLEYPEHHLEILVLDDSTDHTSEKARSLVSFQAARGINIRYLRRKPRTGCKAENLTFGVNQTEAEFFAIFDADFMPPSDFLLKTIPCFKAPELGYLQTGIGYINRDTSFLTKFQAAEMLHQQYVTVGLRADRKMASLSGSSCVWRRACLQSLGGWSATTVTEDVDIGYRAQLENWKYGYLKEVVSLSILPETLSAYRVQRERWGRGLLHNAFKHGAELFRQKMSLAKRLYAISVMFSSLLLVSIYFLFLLTLPLTWGKTFEGLTFMITCMFFFTLVAIWGYTNVMASQMWESLGKDGSFLQRLGSLYGYIAMFLPMSLYYAVGGMRALFGVHNEFNKTPKGRDEVLGEKPKVDTLLFWGEVFSFFYSWAAIGIAVYQDYYMLLPFNITACVAFGLVLYWGWRDNAHHDHADEK
ncbi:glycosyltransferase [Desulfosarcina sp. OttesenSCG-928-A07]|nr:glycosyltransferase [Desulfosarcina sp. OttesenSCG-928-G17]MDL2329832.1 glycosyltransferase [Desulfosarcina sp. OttesenSCG-928-A07]